MHRGFRHQRWCWYVVYLLCFCVFLLSLNAKVSLYGSGSAARLNPSAASKLWANGAKMEIRSAAAFAPQVWLLLLLLFALSLGPLPRSMRVPIAPPKSKLLAQFRPYRFLRPPPAFLN